MWPVIANQISEATGSDFTILDKKPLSGGDINQAFRISDGHKSYFVKLNDRARVDMFRCEWNSLDHLLRTQTLVIPKPICCGTTVGSSFLVLEYLPLGESDEQDWHMLGRQLAHLHRSHSQPMYGWDEDNFLGTSVQPNAWHKKWSTFFAEQRVGWQLKLLEEKGIRFGDIEEIVGAIKLRLANHHPSASLLHGDLWRGNLAFTEHMGVLFDPASYFGDRETDIAMTELFGQFPLVFYQGYHAVWPLDEGYTERRELYNLYHLLNHVNHFGEPYFAQTKTSLYRVIAS
ncbi:fructosamine kinase family protein [Zobellella iuensis]|jgi:fructosamine-3-kinase|uniref:Fructosamine kinase family protein n=1 Tax=Zobellella iuensis TaxID=2803811 RepID=A0ABS1QRC1_9GAMM|nr:fructosamine kinase family protein [Zobellella iuensis]MBL1377331.1 fructosamine kinase family protein [Zobellella iuensis]